MVDTSNQSVPEMAIELPYVFVWLDPQALVKQEAMTVEKMQQSIAHVQRAETREISGTAGTAGRWEFSQEFSKQIELPVVKMGIICWNMKPWKTYMKLMG